jgi:beta-glucanase (GH16 family)
MLIRNIAYRKLIFVALAIVSSFFSNCSDNVSPEINKIDPLKKYLLTWNDDFDGDSLDETKWSHRLPGPRRQAINTKDAVSLDGKGNLIIKTYKEDDNYYTGMIGTQDKFESKYGYWECRMKLQTQTGQWSSFWLQSPLYGEVLGDTGHSGTEIDIMEYLVRFRNIIEHALHWDGYSDDHKIDRYVQGIKGLSKGYHTFGLEWTENMYIFYVDRTETWRTSNAISHRDQYIILSIEVDDWAGNIGQAVLPDSICVDYVHVYQ